MIVEHKTFIKPNKAVMLSAISVGGSLRSDEFDSALAYL